MTTIPAQMLLLILSFLGAIINGHSFLSRMAVKGTSWALSIAAKRQAIKRRDVA
jgi:hypothetical protein